MSFSKKKLIYIREDQQTTNFVENNFKIDTLFKSKISLKERIRKLILRLLVLRHESRDTVVQGSVVMLTIFNDVKIFDLLNKKVVTFYSDSSKYNRYLSDMEYFSTFFNLTFLESEVENKVSIEKLIINENQFIEDKKLFLYQDLIGQYSNYLGQVPAKENIQIENLLSLIEDDSNNPFMKFLSKADLNNINKTLTHLPLYYLHCDLHFDNILLNSNTIFIIDWEHSSNAPFFYDIYNVLFVEILNHKKFCLLEKYLSGNFDSEFTLLFNSVGSNFNNQFRMEYFMCSILYRYFYFDLKHNEKLKVNERYCVLLDRLKYFLCK